MQGVVGIDVRVGEQDDAAVGMVGRNLIGPRQHLVARPEFQREHQPVHPAGAEQMIAIIHAIGFKHAAERREVLELAQGKVLVEKSRNALACPESVMIAQRHRIRHHAVQQTHAGPAERPFRSDILIRDIAFVQNKNNVRVILVGRNPLGLRRKDFACATRIFPGVTLGVRQRHD